MKSSKTIIIVPAYNEEKNIPALIKNIKEHTNDSQILLIDDGSKDKTSEVAKTLGATVITHSTNRGKGEALYTAFEWIKKKPFETIIIMDADLQFSAKDVPRIERALRLYDFVMGQRNWKNVPFRHRMGNFVWRSLFNLLYGTKLRDTNCGLIGFRKEIINKLNVRGGYIVENMMLSSAIKNKIKIGQVPVDVTYHIIHGVPRGARVVSGVFFFILKDGLKYRFGRKKSKR